MHLSTERVLVLIKEIHQNNKAFGEPKILDMDKKEVLVRNGSHYNHTERCYKFRVKGNRLSYRGKSRVI